MIEYPKIPTLYERGADFSVTDVLKSPVIGTINLWHVTEKINGTNIRIDLRRGGDGADVVTFGGRTPAAQIHADLYKYMQATFTVEKMASLRVGDDPVSITLFGEGYGAGIQNGGVYRQDKAVILFDVLIADRWWLTYAQVADIAARLEVPVVPSLGNMTLEEISGVARSFQSKVGTNIEAEGIVAVPIETLYDKQMQRIIIKLKASDFRKGKRRS